MRSSSRSFPRVAGVLGLSLLVVLTTLGFLFVTPRAVDAKQQNPTQASSRTVNVELILDASGSMAETIGNETRMQIAKRVMREVINAIPERQGVNVGFRVYGHRGDNTEAGKAESCRSSDLLVPIEGVNKPALLRQVDTFQPTGWTPLAYSLEQSGGDFEPGGESITNSVILVTDGLETCGGDPCAVARSLNRANVRVVTNVVSFALTTEEQQTLQCIADEGGGELYGAQNADELSAALFTVLEQLQVLVQNGFLEIESIGGLWPKAKVVGRGGATDANPQGTTVTIVMETSNRIELAVGQYDVSWTNPSGQETRIRVNIEAERVTWIRGSIIEFPQGAGEIYQVKAQDGVVVWNDQFELGDRVWVLPGIYRLDLVERVGDPILISAELQTLPGTVTKLEVLTAP